MSDRPTKKQQILLQFIGDFIKEHGYGPSYREIMRGLDYKSVSTVAVHVDGLITRGWLRKRDNSARSLEVTSPSSTAGDQKTSSGESQLDTDLQRSLTERCDSLLQAPDSNGQDIEALIRVMRLFDFSKIADRYQLKHEQNKQNQL